MKINLNSITFKTISTLLIASTLFVLFIVFSAKYLFSNGYLYLEKEKICIIEKNISPSIALNLSYGFEQAVDEIGNKTIQDPNVLLLQVQEKNSDKIITFSKQKATLKELIANKEFVSRVDLIDPTTSLEIGKMTLVYSKNSYKKYMQDFYVWLFYAVLCFILAIIFVAYSLFNSLKNLNILASSLKNFNPHKPKKLPLKIDSKDEVSSISSSANIMVDNLIQYITYIKELNSKLSLKQTHLKEAQRIANVGSWQYDVVNDKLELSDEIYRIIGIKQNKNIKWDDYLSFIADKDYDYILKVLKKSIKNGSNFDLRYSIQIENRPQIEIQTRGKVRKKSDGSVKITAVSLDITQETKNKKIIERLAYYDSLTKLPNRTLLKDRIHKALQNAKREKTKIAILFLDLDHFKLINDTLGHDTGDKLLIYVANLLKTQLRESDTVSRIGGDEFVVLLPSFNSIEDVHAISKKLVEALQGQHNIESHQLYITTSMGISIYPDHGSDLDTLITNADTAMYDAKNDGRNNYKFFSQSMGNFISKQMEIEQDLKSAVKNRAELEIYYQPKIDTYDNFVSGAEALIRWNHPTKGLMFPDEFINIAESTGLMLEMGEWIIEECISQIDRWNKFGLVGLKIAINLSARQFQDSDLIPFISSMIKKYKIDPAQLEFEITETLSMSNIEGTLRTLTYMKNIGVSIAIDDFGTGYSSLSYLKKFPINIVKIDKSFVIDMIDDEGDKIIVQTIISMAHSLGFRTVAEGVETGEHVALLKEMECDQLQGYHFSKAVTKDEFEKFLKNYIPNV